MVNCDVNVHCGEMLSKYQRWYYLPQSGFAPVHLTLSTLTPSSIFLQGSPRGDIVLANASARCSVFPPSTFTTFPPIQLKSRSLNFQRMACGTRGKTADQTDKRSTLQLITSIVIHQSKAIISLLMKFQFAFSAFHVDIFHIATVLW